MRITIDWCQTCRNGIHPAKHFADTDLSKAAEVVMDISPHGLAFILRLDTGEESVHRMTPGKDEQRRKNKTSYGGSVKAAPGAIKSKVVRRDSQFCVQRGDKCLSGNERADLAQRPRFPRAAEALLLWVYAGGCPARHLMARRKKEYQLFLSV